MKVLSILLSCFLAVNAGPATEVAAYKGQFCTDPRTMRKHAAYTEWADAYSCTRHRCQPGGRNLAIYTVGCKRVEAPESAIECEEVVEDTNMQFPYCCTRLRCLVVVRGEVWTRVLGQPWETLPAAPWSHMYKMKKPPPADGTFLPKTEEGPVYELQMPETAESGGGEDKVLRSLKKPTESPDCNDVVARAAPAPAPDIVIALSTGSDKELIPKKENNPRHNQRGERSQSTSSVFEEGEPRAEEEEAVTEKEKSEERYYANTQKQVQPQQPNPVSAEQHFYDNAQKNAKQNNQLASWTEIPQNQWQERDPTNENGPAIQQRSNMWNDRERHEPEALRMAPPEAPSNPSPAQTWEHQSIQPPEFTPNEEIRRNEEKKEEKPGNLQALVDAIGTRMRDIESVVARMSEKVHEDRKEPPDQSFRSSDKDHNYHEAKKPNPENDHYKRFSPSSRSKYVRTNLDTTTEQPLFVEDTNLNGYFSDASNSMVNRRTPPKEPAATYMAPVVDNRRNNHVETPEEAEKKHKKKSHKKKHAKGHHKKHHSKDDKRRKFRLNSVELDRNAVSLEDSSGANSNANNGTFDNSID